MKILLYTLNFFPELTGIGKYSGEMAEWLANCGHEIRVVSSPPYYPEWHIHNKYSRYFYSKQRLSSNLQIWRCPLWVPRAPTGLKRILHLASFALSSFPVIIRQAFWCPDVIFLVEPTIFCAPSALTVSFFSRSKSWLHIQDFEIDAAFNLGIFKSKCLRSIIINLERLLLNKFSVISTISNKMILRLSEKGIDGTSIVLFRNWVNLSKIKPNANLNYFRESLNINKDTVVALYSGNMGEKQGLEIVIEAARRFEKNRKIIFVMCGDGVAKSTLMSQGAGLKNILWLSLQPTEKLNELLNLADIHLLPQRADVADLVMPSKLTGMLASGRPVIATALYGTEVASVVEKRGVVVPPGDVDAFSEAIYDLAIHPGKRLELGMAAREFASMFLDINSVMAGFEKKLHELIVTDGEKSHSFK